MKTNFGYHLIQVEKITPAAPQTFETAKEAAKQQAVAERQEKVMKTYMDAVKKEVGFREGAAKAAAKPASAKKVAK